MGKRVAIHLVRTAVLGLLLLSLPALAAEVRDPETGFAADLDVPGHRICVLKPRGAGDPQACADIGREDADAALRALPRDAFAVAVPVGDVRATLITLTKTRGNGSATPSVKEMDETVGGAVKASREGSRPARVRGTDPSSRYDAVTLPKGARAARFLIEFEGEAPPSGAVTYFIFGSEALFSVSVGFGPGGQAEALAIANRIANSVSLPVRSPDYERGYQYGKLAWRGLVALGGLVALWFAARTFFRAERAAAERLRGEHGPPLDDGWKKRAAAKASWLCPILAVGTSFFGGKEMKLPLSIVGSVAIFLGAGFAIYALTGLARHPRAGILVPAGIGLVVNASFVMLAIVGLALR
jgi:hypothetical protein